MATLATIDIRLRAMTTDLEKGFKRANRFVNDFNRVTSGLSRRITSRVIPAFIAFQAATIGLIKSFITASSEAEQFRIRLTALLGSADEAGKTFKDMADFAGRVPFEYKEIMESATSLSGVLKGGRDEINRYMPIIADLAAVTGLTIQETTGQIIRMYSAGAASADMFRERGVLAMLGFQAGVSVSAEETRDRLIAAWEDAGSKFRGASDALGESWQGLMSMVSDRWFQFKLMVSDAGLFDAAKNAAQRFLDFLKRETESGALANFAGKISDTLINAVRGMGRILSVVAGAISKLESDPLIAREGLMGYIMFGAKGAAGFIGIGQWLDEVFSSMTEGVTAVERLERRAHKLRAVLSGGDLGLGLMNMFSPGKVAALRAELRQIESTLDMINKEGTFAVENTGNMSTMLLELAAALETFGMAGDVAGDVTGGIADGVADIVPEINKVISKAEDAGKAIVDSMVNNMSDFIIQTQNAGEAFGNLVDTILREISRLAVRMGLAAIATAIFGPAAGAFVAGVPVGGGGGGAPAGGGGGGASSSIVKNVTVNVFPRPLTMGEEDTWARKLKPVLERI